VSAPTLSVAMPVRNALPYLVDALHSVQAQTLDDFELVALDDASTDGSTEFLRDAAESDPRIRLIERGEPAGPVEVFNHVVAECAAPIVARMDADDISHPDRLQRELDAIEADPAVVLVGTLSDGIDSRGRLVRPRDRWRLIRCTAAPFPHGSAMFLRRAFDEVGGYRAGAGNAADIDLFVRLGRIGKVVVLPAALYRYRYHLGTMTLTHAAEQLAQSAHAVRTARNGTPPTDPLPAGELVSARRSQAAMRLWAGHPAPGPREMIRAGTLRAGARGFAAVAWASWASVSPASLRWFLRGLVRVRDALAGVWVRAGRPREWRFG
jgi:glycosyltransferase involved in cell wall biosynthesis